MIFLLSCSNDGVVRNPYLQEVGFRFDMNLNLPLYSKLTNIGSIVFVENAGVGLKGVYVIQSGIDQYRAFEASCPNHVPNDCSQTVLNGIVATCGCEDYEYNLYTGQLTNAPKDDERRYDMLEYRATRSGNIVLISN
ncbi:MULTISPECIES: hypothetical protein [Zobellia]|uniref:hypothetical protein n=1 Tax=Zobellia TaxID=112040 RepID=UPI001BFF8DAD|nr:MULTISPECIES: hypothetical protein [Zobellia]MBT9188243.1 hypothetical protein [Zobellia russellii]MBU2974527.1 hypothetical protein [Zobellia sp. B3R18]MDO6818378.1 hypothetical protein [Zobellia sp. 1_MG-2023]